MRRLAVLAIVVGVCAALLSATAAHAGSSECKWAVKFTGECPTTPEVENQGNQIAISAEHTTPGQAHRDGGGGGDWYERTDPPPGWNPGPVVPWIQTEDGATQNVCDGGNPRCLSDRPSSEPEPEPEAETEIEIPEFTVNDLAVFAPPPPALEAEPAGVGIVGMPVNFVVAATTHTASGELLGFPLQVRFTPISYDFSYGDGTASTTTTGGATWPSLGLAQFTATATSHAYGARGTYTTSVDVNYAAALDLGGGWFEIPGTLTLSTAGSTVEIFEVHTALVERTCLEDPAGPGC